MKIAEKLLLIQTKLKANKSQWNKFGEYHYRSLEDIYEAVKPLLEETKTVLTVDNDLLLLKDTIFRKSIATLTCVETGEKMQASTFTQEGFNKPKMSPEQCSGSAASYSDKYCLNKLFCIDDTKDEDSTNTHGKEDKPVRVGKPETKVDAANMDIKPGPAKPEAAKPEAPKRSFVRASKPVDNKPVEPAKETTKPVAAKPATDEEVW